MTSENLGLSVNRRPPRVTHKPILTARRPGIEKLLNAMPISFNDNERDDLRRWALALTADASAWEINKLKRAARPRGLF